MGLDWNLCSLTQSQWQRRQSQYRTPDEWGLRRVASQFSGFFFHIWYLTQLSFTVAMQPPLFPSPMLIPTPDERTEAWHPFFFSFFIDNYFLQIVSIARVSFFLCSRTVYYSINIIWLHIRMYEIAESNYFLNYVLHPLFSLITMFYINSHTLQRYT